MTFAIETKRLLLRDFRENDWQPFVQNLKAPLVQDGILSFQSDDSEIRKKFENGLLAAKQSSRPGYLLTVILKDPHIIIGTCSIIGTLNQYRQTKIGWHFGSAYKGNGYATETAIELLRLGFHRHNVARIFADCFAHNIASIRVMEKSGMTSHRNNFFARWVRAMHYGEQQPILRHHILKEQWLVKETKSPLEILPAESAKPISVN
jgi:[ribosomal protein S5]-alanine N-acetyltransferase